MPRSKRARFTISWDTKEGAVDVRSLLEHLSETEDGPYSGRPLAEIGGMVLAKWLPQEVKSYGRQDDSR